MTSNQLRNLSKKYFNNPLGKSLNHVARETGISKPTLIKFLHGGSVKLAEEKTRALLNIIAPWLLDSTVAAGAIKKQLLVECRSKDEISEIARKLAEPTQTSS